MGLRREMLGILIEWPSIPLKEDSLGIFEDSLRTLGGFSEDSWAILSPLRRGSQKGSGNVQESPRSL